MSLKNHKKVITDILIYLIVMVLFSVSFYQDIKNVFFGVENYLTGPGYLVLDICGIIASTTFLVIDLKKE